MDRAGRVTASADQRTSNAGRFGGSQRDNATFCGGAVKTAAEELNLFFVRLRWIFPRWLVIRGQWDNPSSRPHHRGDESNLALAAVGQPMVLHTQGARDPTLAVLLSWVAFSPRRQALRD